VAGAALCVIGAVSGLMQIDLISRAATTGISDAEAAANDSRQQLIGILQLLVVVGTVIAFLGWFHRSHRNLPSLGNSELKYSPGWAVGGFFVPFLNLVRPFQVMREVWHGSDPAGFSRDTAPDGHKMRNALGAPTLVGLWWMLFLVTSFLGRVIFQMAVNDNATIEELQTFSELLLVADLIDIPAAVVLYILAGRITTWQLERHDLARSLDSAAIAEPRVSP
jgi:hypothetical protein